MSGVGSPEGDSGPSPAALTGERLEAIQRALGAMELEGWLLVVFHHQNPVASSVLGVEGPTRRGFALLPDQGDPVALIHPIDDSLWSGWRWELLRYGGWKEMEALLPELLGERTRLALETSPDGALPTLDRVPAGVLGLLERFGVQPVDSGDLVTTFHSRWTPRQLEVHRRTARTVRQVIHDAFRHAGEGIRDGRPVTEGELSERIRTRLPEAGVGLDVDCVVAVGAGASDPHYQPQGSGREIREGELLLVDAWGRPGQGEVFADQTWMGYLGHQVPPRIQEIWDAVRDAREAALAFLRHRWEEGRDVRGYEVDDACRSVIENRGFGRYFVHRTGHSMDTELHGSGPNLDNLETHDGRRLLPGVGFSVEPGIYIPGEIGVRSEVNVHWSSGGPEVTTPDPQVELLRPLGE